MVPRTRTSPNTVTSSAVPRHDDAAKVDEDEERDDREPQHACEERGEAEHVGRVVAERERVDGDREDIAEHEQPREPAGEPRPVASAQEDEGATRLVVRERQACVRACGDERQRTAGDQRGEREVPRERDDDAEHAEDASADHAADRHRDRLAEPELLGGAHAAGPTLARRACHHRPRPEASAAAHRLRYSGRPCPGSAQSAARSRRSGTTGATRWWPRAAASTRTCRRCACS